MPSPEKQKRASTPCATLGRSRFILTSSTPLRPRPHSTTSPLANAHQKTFDPDRVLYTPRTERAVSARGWNNAKRTSSPNSRAQTERGPTRSEIELFEDVLEKADRMNKRRPAYEWRPSKKGQIDLIMDGKPRVSKHVVVNPERISANERLNARLQKHKEINDKFRKRFVPKPDPRRRFGWAERIKQKNRMEAEQRKQEEIRARKKKGPKQDEVAQSSPSPAASLDQSRGHSRNSSTQGGGEALSAEEMVEKAQKMSMNVVYCMNYRGGGANRQQLTSYHYKEGGDDSQSSTASARKEFSFVKKAAFDKSIASQREKKQKTNEMRKQLTTRKKPTSISTLLTDGPKTKIRYGSWKQRLELTGEVPGETEVFGGMLKKTLGGR